MHRTDWDKNEDLNKDENILIIPAGRKGKATVVMNTTDYDYTIKELLDPSTYKKLTKDPTQTIIKNVNSQIKQSTIPENINKTDIQGRSVAFKNIWFAQDS